MSVLAAMAPVPETNRSLAVAVVVSLILHAALLVWVPEWRIDVPVELPPIVATIQSTPTAQPGSAPAAPVTTPPEAAEPESPPQRAAPPAILPPKPKVERPVRPEPKPAPIEKAKPQPTPVAPPVTAPPSDDASTSSTQPSNDASPEAPASGADVPEAPNAAGALPQPSGPVVDGSALDAYRAAVYAAAGRYRDYPRYARSRGWEGRAVVRLEIDARGRAGRISVASSSGYEVLDKSALEMVRKAQRDVPVPQSLRGRAFNVDVAVMYELKD